MTRIAKTRDFQDFVGMQHPELSEAQVFRVTRIVLRCMEDYLLTGESLRIGRIGTLVPNFTDSGTRQWSNCRTGKTYIIKDKARLKFVPARKYISRLSKTLVGYDCKAIPIEEFDGNAEEE